MAKEIKFNVKLTVDGKEQLVTATTTADELRKSLSGISRVAADVDKKLFRFNQRMMRLQTIASSLSQVADGLNTLTQESRSYSAAMTAANTMAGKGSEDFARLKDQVSDLSKTVPVARDQLANGLYQVISNGVPENNWIEYLQASAKASVGGIADLGEVVKVTSTVIKNYGLQWQDAEGIQDKIQLTAKNGVTTFEQLAQALPRVTGSAAALGVSVDELMASFATLTGVSGNTAEVSTQLQAIFTALVKPSSEAAKMAQQMGIQFDASAVKAAGGLQAFLTSLQQSVRQYSASSGVLEQEVYGRLFGSAEALRALIPLNGELAQAFAKNVDSMKDSAGTMDDAFNTMSGTGSAQLQMLKNKFAEMFDYIAGAAKTIQPYLNFGAQLGMSLSGVIALVNAVESLSFGHAALAAATKASAAANAIWTASGMAADTIMKMLGISSVGAAAGVTALKLAIRGLIIATGVGIAIAALTTAVEMLMNATSGSSSASADAAKAMREQAQAADEVKQAYDSTLKQTYADLMSKYAKLKQGWQSLANEQRKMEWIKENQAAFHDLGLKINSAAEAENTFNRQTDAVVAAFKRRALAAAYAAKLTALYQKQMDLTFRKQQADKASYNARQQANHSNATSNRDNPYAKQIANRAANIAAIGADMRNGGDGNIGKLNSDLKAINKEIAATEQQLRKTTAESNRLASTNATATHNTPTSTHAAGGRNATATAADTDRKALEGSIDWYEQQLSDLQKRIQATADTETAKALQGQYDQMGGKLKELKVEIGIEKPQPTEAKTAIEQLREQLAEAQAELENAATIDAKVKADAKAQDIQRQIDEATKGKLTITAEAEPGYTTQGSTADKRQSRANAESRIGAIRQDYEIGITGKGEALEQIEKINKQLAGLGLKPIEIPVEISGADKAKEKVEGAWDSIKQMGSALSGLGNEIEMPELNIAGTLAQAIATMAQGYATATAQAATLGPWAWIAFAATGLAQLTTMIASVKQAGAFATGGIVGGNSPSGDRLMARVNSGEMILNKAQQQRLLAMANGAARPVALPMRPQQAVTLDVASLGSMIDRQPITIQGDFRLQGKDLVASASNYTRIAAKSGRRTLL